MKHPTYEIDQIGETFDCEVQNRATPLNDKQYAVFYCWLNNGRRRIGLNEGDLIRWNRYGLPLRGKIAQIDRSYYSGTCPVLYVKLTPTSYRKLAERRLRRKEGGPERTENQRRDTI